MSNLRSGTKIGCSQLTCRGAPRGYPRVEELALLTTGVIFDHRFEQSPHPYVRKQRAKNPLNLRSPSY
jgi:hypothetical protein